MQTIDNFTTHFLELNSLLTNKELNLSLKGDQLFKALLTNITSSYPQLVNTRLRVLFDNYYDEDDELLHTLYVKCLANYCWHELFKSNTNTILDKLGKAFQIYTKSLLSLNTAGGCDLITTEEGYVQVTSFSEGCRPFYYEDENNSDSSPYSDYAGWAVLTLKSDEGLIIATCIDLSAYAISHIGHFKLDNEIYFQRDLNKILFKQLQSQYPILQSLKFAGCEIYSRMFSNGGSPIYDRIECIGGETKLDLSNLNLPLFDRAEALLEVFSTRLDCELYSLDRLG